MKNRIEEFIGPFTVLYHDERSKTFARDQDGFTKQCSTSQIRNFLEKSSILDDSSTERENRRLSCENDQNEHEYDDDNVQLNVDKQSYGEQSIYDDI